MSRNDATGAPLPALFVSHGAPTVALETNAYTAALGEFGSSVPRPSAILVVSAHWETRGGILVTAVPRPRTIHDFSGFPPALYGLKYPSPGAPDLAREVVALLSKAGHPASADEARGLDHGAWIPLRLAFPAADVPVVQVSLPVPRSPASLLAVGRALAPLRSRGVLIIGSGGVVHNLGLVRFGEPDAPADPWASAFDAWAWERVARGEDDALAAYRTAAPHADLAVPTTEHLDPLFVTIGSRLPGDAPAPIHEGFQYGNLSMRTFAFG